MEWRRREKRRPAAAGWEDEFGSAGVSAFSDPAEGTFVDYGFFHEFDVTCDNGSSGRGSRRASR